MKLKRLRIAVPLVVGLLVALGFMFGTGFGDLSAIGWGDISLLCPLGAFTTMVAQKALVPRALISLVVALVLMAVFGRLFCGWICPIPLVNKLPQLFRKKEKSLPEQAGEANLKPLTDEEAASLKSACGDGCASARVRAGAFDSRHLVLLGTILSATIFGFPVFCLICPIGLSFATIFLVISLFGGGDITWSIIVVPVLLLLEVTVFKKWCSWICPLGAMMSLMGRLNRKVLQPAVDETSCIEAKGGICGRCAAACEVGIDPHKVEDGADLAECTKCGACVEACPAKAVRIPVLKK